jgi:hypothetical protein
VRISDAQKRLAASTSGRRKIGKIDYQAQGVLYITEKARFATLLSLPEGTDIGKAINDGMKAIESENEDLKDVLPKACNTLDKTLLISLLKNFSSIPITIEGDAFGEKFTNTSSGNLRWPRGTKTNAIPSLLRLRHHNGRFFSANTTRSPMICQTQLPSPAQLAQIRVRIKLHHQTGSRCALRQVKAQSPGRSVANWGGNHIQ